MSTRIESLFGAKTSKPTPTSVNRDGFPCYTRPLEEQLLQTLVTNTFGQTFYVDQKGMVEESAKVHAAAAASDVDFYAKALAYAREHAFMRSQPVYGLAMLAKLDGTLFERAFGKVIRTPKDLFDFVQVVRAQRGNLGGRRIKRVVGQWLAAKLSANPYWAIKYGADRDGGFSLRDLIRLYHPKTGEPSSVVGYLLGSLVVNDGLVKLDRQIWAFEQLKVAQTDEDKIRWIAEGRLPHEVATSFAGKSRAVWSAIVPQLPIFALVRNLATLERHGVLDEHRDLIVDKLTNAEAVANSKMFPHRFLEASKHVRDPRVTDALRRAVDLAFESVPEIPGRTAVFLDISGSMGGCIQQAALFALAAIKKAGGNGLLWLYDTQVDEFRFSLHDSLLSQAERIGVRGGTNTSLPMQRLLSRGERVDNILLITDEQQNTGTAFVTALDGYRRRVNGQAKCFVLNVAAYRDALVPESDTLTHYIYGWSDQALAFVGLAARGFGSMVDAVRASRLEA